MVGFVQIAIRVASYLEVRGAQKSQVTSSEPFDGKLDQLLMTKVKGFGGEEVSDRIGIRDQENLAA